MIAKKTNEWKLYVGRWRNGHHSVHFFPREPDQEEWFEILDKEGDPETVEVREILAAANLFLSFEQPKEDERFSCEIFPEPHTLAELFDFSEEVAWPS